MYSILTCNGYNIEREVNALDEAIKVCRELELASNDGFARIVSHHGRIIADAEGEYEGEEYYVDAATQTGMYDHW